ncbi:MAG: hypothetical protein GY804_03555 [Alphaproteobacteria bacterium]|nr:hypothetical protein [Alphaproteobacteria bacterium]
MSDMENKMSDLIDSGLHEQSDLYKQIEQLKVDRLELANVVIDNHAIGRYGEACRICNKWHTEMPHDPDCIVPKAEKIIKENK